MREKERVLRLLLSFAAQFIHLDKAIMATLGGVGLEADIWQEHGFLKDQGWLIERKRSRRRKLISKFPYQYCNRLSSFPAMFITVNGNSTGVDIFHLDLCGTFEVAAQDFSRILPVVLKSAGRCVAVTIADQRKNRSTDDFERAYNEGKSLFGEETAHGFFKAIEAEQRQLIPAGFGLCADPVLGAKREFGFAVRLAQVIGESRAFYIDRMERYAYSSKNGNAHPFRMRTYFFHFGKMSGRNNFVSPEDVAASWAASALKCVVAEGLKTIAVKSTPQMGKEKEMKPRQYLEEKYSHLTALLQHASPECRKEFDLLVVEATFGRRMKAAITEELLNDPRNEVVPMPEEKGRARKPRKGGKDSEQIEFLFTLLRAKLKGEKELAAAKKEAAKARYGRSKKGLARVGTAFARTQGKHAVGFAKRVLKHRPDLFDELSGLYNMTPENLRKEAAKKA